MALISGVLGSLAIKASMFDFTAGGRYPDVFSNFETFKRLSSTIEDIGVAAFKGQMGNLAGTPVLSTALQFIQSRRGTRAPSGCLLASRGLTARSIRR